MLFLSIYPFPQGPPARPRPFTPAADDEFNSICGRRAIRSLSVCRYPRRSLRLTTCDLYLPGCYLGVGGRRLRSAPRPPSAEPRPKLNKMSSGGRYSVMRRRGAPVSLPQPAITISLIFLSRNKCLLHYLQFSRILLVELLALTWPLHVMMPWGGNPIACCHSSPMSLVFLAARLSRPRWKIMSGRLGVFARGERE